MPIIAAPYLGKGTAFPLRIRTATGGMAVTEGVTDAVSVILEYLNESWTIREETNPKENHIAESIAHILLTHQGEHDTLPEFGSHMREILFEPNINSTYYLIEHWMETSTERWEKRVKVSHVDFTPTGYGIDQGKLPATAYVTFIAAQVQGNLVAPFVTPRQARLQEYAASLLDDSGHDYESRYFGIPRHERNGTIFTRFPRDIHMPPENDDQFYLLDHSDTSWLLVSWKLYRDIRYWPYLARCFVYDQAAKGLSRLNLDPNQMPEYGTVVRVPSQRRILTLVSQEHK